MEIRQVVATFILTGLLFTGSSYYYNNEINEKKDDIEKLEESQGLKDSEIAKLVDVVETKDKDIKLLNLKLDKKVEVVKNQKKVIDVQKDVIDEQKKLMDFQKAELIKLREVNKPKSVSFNKVKKGSDVQGGRKLNAEMTAYIAMCREGCTGITATGVNVKNTTTYQGMRVIATDPNVIPLYSIVKVDVNGQSFNAISLDTGGAIKGSIVDYLVGSEREAYNFGRQKATITVLREGKG